MPSGPHVEYTPPRSGGPPTGTKKKKPIVAIVAVAVVLLLLIGVGAVLATSGGDDDGGGEDVATGDEHRDHRGHRRHHRGHRAGGLRTGDHRLRPRRAEQPASPGPRRRGHDRRRLRDRVRGEPGLRGRPAPALLLQPAHRARTRRGINAPDFGLDPGDWEVWASGSPFSDGDITISAAQSIGAPALCVRPAFGGSHHSPVHPATASPSTPSADHRACRRRPPPSPRRAPLVRSVLNIAAMARTNAAMRTTPGRTGPRGRWCRGRGSPSARPGPRTSAR